MQVGGGAEARYMRAGEISFLVRLGSFTFNQLLRATCLQRNEKQLRNSQTLHCPLIQPSQRARKTPQTRTEHYCYCLANFSLRYLTASFLLSHRPGFPMTLRYLRKFTLRGQIFSARYLKSVCPIDVTFCLCYGKY